jgi:hypothetical protein
MSRVGQIKYPFVIRTIEERIILEEKLLRTFKKYYNENPMWAQTNIDSCNHRLNELKEGIEVMSNNLKNQSDNEKNL